MEHNTVMVMMSLWYTKVSVKKIYVDIYVRNNTQIFQKLKYLHLFTNYFMKIFLQSLEQIKVSVLNHLHALYICSKLFILFGGVGGGGVGRDWGVD